MRILYFDCTGGVSGDMVVGAMRDLGVTSHAALAAGGREVEDVHKHCGNHSHGRTYAEVMYIIETADASEHARTVAGEIYSVIAMAECMVHDTIPAEMHFHEVGRDEAILNALMVGSCLEQLEIDEVCCSIIMDGHGSIECSHGNIPVPVPAVRAMMDECDYVFGTAEVETEMVTPSGLGMLIGMGAVYQEDMPEGTLLCRGRSVGSRNTGSEGMTVSLIEC